jgi:signal transduction histidine kinase
MKASVLAGIVHDLRNPLTAIKGFVELLRQGRMGPVSSTQEGGLIQIMASLREMERLLANILELARGETGMLHPSINEVDVVQLLEEQLDAIRPLMIKKGLEARRDVYGSIPVIFSDRQRLYRIFSNLLSNAVKYTEKGYVQVIIRNLPGRSGVSIEVIDTGTGIPPEALPGLFIFKGELWEDRRDWTQERHGLGLPIVRRLLQSIQGSIQVESQPGKGSRFEVFLPYRIS